MKQIYQILFHNQCTTCALCVQILCIFSISRRKTKVWVSWKKHGSYIWKYTARLTNKIIWYKTYCCSVMKIYILNCILLTWCVGTFLFRDNRIGIVFYNTYFIVDKAKIFFVMQSYTTLISRQLSSQYSIVEFALSNGEIADFIHSASVPILLYCLTILHEVSENKKTIEIQWIYIQKQDNVVMPVCPAPTYCKLCRFESEAAF